MIADCPCVFCIMQTARRQPNAQSDQALLDAFHAAPGYWIAPVVGFRFWRTLP